MMGLAKFLVETILGEAAEMDKVVVVYSGRFQPFHKGHYATYDHLVKKFGKDNVYIGTSDVTDTKKSPFGFKEKKAIMQKMFGISSNKIVQIKNPYAPQEILNKFNSDTTGFITVVGEKDSSRLGGKYFTPYKGKVEAGYLDKGYVYAAPAQPNAISGTDVRYWLSAGNEEERKKNFTKAYPKFDDQIFKMITLKLKKLKECINEEIKLNVSVGDQILMGKFKNKKVVVKSIGKDEWGMPTINGKKAVTFRIPKKEELKEAASTGGFTGQDEPDTSFVADGQPRILNKAKPENWYKQGGYTQMDTPKADAMRGRGKSKDTETQFRKAYYKLKNVVQSTLNPADDPFKVEDWQDVYRENPDEKPKRFWELPDNQKNTIISKEDINEIMDEFEENIMSEMGLGGGAGVGLSLPGGYINGAPDPKDAKKLKSKLDGDGSDEYTPVKEATSFEILKDLDKVKSDLLKKAEVLIAKKKKLYSNVDIESPMSVDEKKLDKDIADIFSQINQLVLQKRSLKKENTNEMAKADMDAVEKYADQQLAPGDIELGKETDHFFQRLNDPRNGKEISPAELTGFFKRLAKNKKKFLEFVKQYKEFVVKDKRTNINIPFVVMANKLIAKTIMRKDNFKSSTPIYVSEQIVNEDVKWQEDTYRKCMLGKLPLSLNIVKQLVEPIRTTSLHATDVENLPKVAALQGTKKSISTFTKTTKWGKLVQGKGMHTKGGILVALSGVVLAQSIMDLWTEPDKQGRRWVNPGTVISGLGREQDVVFNFAPELKKYKENWKKHSFDGTITNAEKAEFIKKYYDAAEKYMLSKKKEFQDKYLNSNKLYYDSDWNEVVLTDIKIEKILAVPSNWSDDEVENEKTLKQLKQKYKNVEVADKESEIQNFIKQNGGSIIESTNQTKDLIMEGGAYGHMAHPFDIEMNLTFGDLKTIVTKALNGDLELAREKTDGQALAVSWVNGRLVAARNKSHLKNKGEGAMTIGQVAAKFAGRGGLTDAYNFAMQDLSKAIAALSEPQRKKIFKDGSSFMNLEVIYPTSVNVIPYNQPLLVFHGTFDYDINGTIVGENQQAASILGGMIKQVNAHVQSKYTIQGPPMNKLPKSEDLSKLKGKYISMIGKLQSEFALSDNDGVAEYHQAWWTKFVEKGGKNLDTQEKIGLVKRWAFNDKSFRINTIQDPKLKAWAEQIDKQDQQKISKQNLMRFEEIFLGVGADVLSFMSSVLTANPDSAKRQMVARLEATIQQVKASGDPKKIEKLKLELQRLNALGGFDKIVPNEGIVFVYNGNTYKLTGAFAPLNQILGIFFDS